MSGWCEPCIQAPTFLSPPPTRRHSPKAPSRICRDLGVTRCPRPCASKPLWEMSLDTPWHPLAFRASCLLGVALCGGQNMCACVLVAQSCLTPCDSIGCSPPGSSVHGILQARILEWVAVPFSRGSSQARDRTEVSCIAGRFFTVWATREALMGRIMPPPKISRS